MIQVIGVKEKSLDESEQIETLSHGIETWFSPKEKCLLREITQMEDIM
jgi:hypothetical protein